MPTSRSTASHHGASGPDAPACFCPGTSSASAFAAGEPTRHSWVHGHGSDIDRLARLPPVLPASAALGEVMRAAVTAARVSLPTSTQVTAALASAAVWRYIGEAEYHEAGPSTPVERARGFIHDRLPDADVDLRAIAAVADVTPAHPVRRFRAELGPRPWPTSGSNAWRPASSC